MASLWNVFVISLLIFSVFVKINCLYDEELASIVSRTLNQTADGPEGKKISRFEGDLSRKRRNNSQLAVLSLRGRRPIKHTVNNITLSLLLCCGDIECDPGPKTTRAIRFPCTACGISVTARSKAISCDSCEEWTHIKCSGEISNTQYENAIRLDADINYTCSPCQLKELPDPSVNDDPPPVEIVTPPTSPPDHQDAEQFKIFQKKGLNFIHVNIRSLRNKITELSIIANKTGASIVAVSETWLDSTFTDTEITLPGYNVQRKDRNALGGGVCLYVKDNLAYNQRQDLESDDIESTWIELYLRKTKPIIVGCVYRPPTKRDFISKLQETISSVATSNELFILGDTNINLNLDNNRCALSNQFRKMLKLSG